MDMESVGVVGTLDLETVLAGIPGGVEEILLVPVEEEAEENENETIENGEEPEPNDDDNIARQLAPDAMTDDKEDSEDDDDEDEEIFEVESILQERTKRGVKEYFVRWKGYGPEYDTWEPEDNLNCEDIVEEFKRRQQQQESAQKGQKRSSRGRPLGKKRNKFLDEDYEEEESDPPPKKKRGRAPKPPKKEISSKKKGRPSKKTKEPPLIIKCKTIFKKQLIEKCIRNEDRRNPDDDNSPETVVKYFLRYDIDTGDFFVGPVKVEVDEEEKRLICTACTKTYGALTPEQKLTPGKTPLQQWQMCREMKLHIIGRHLEGFTCQYCDEPYVFHTRGSTHYYRHIGLFHKDRNSSGGSEGRDGGNSFDGIDGEGGLEGEGEEEDEED